MIYFRSEILVLLIVAIVGCDKDLSKLNIGEELPITWSKTSPPDGYQPTSTEARAYVYWHNAYNIMSQIFQVEHGWKLHHPEGLPPVIDPLAYRTVVQRLESLSVEGVDADALDGVREIIKAYTDLAVHHEEGRVMFAQQAIDKVDDLAKTVRDAQSEVNLITQKLNAKYAPLEFNRIKLY